MKHPILGLHHVTATVGEAQADLDFYRETLGLRLLKRTVNFDNPRVYHFYYGDEQGTPGTIWTTFPYSGWGVPQGRHGRGQITATAFSIPAGSLSFWSSRLAERGARADEVDQLGGAPAIRFQDPSGLIIQLVEDSADRRQPWTDNGIGTEAAIRGLHHIRMVVADPARTLRLMTDLLGYKIVDQTEERVRLAVNGDLAGRRIEVVSAPSAPPAVNGIGTVHHVAMAIASGDEQVRLRQELISLKYTVTEVLDRQYFQSIYFREPGGVLFEVATVGPGFLVDEPIAELGQSLKLPPWEEPNRSSIEQGLPPIRQPRPLHR